MTPRKIVVDSLVVDRSSAKHWGCRFGFACAAACAMRRVAMTVLLAIAAAPVPASERLLVTLDALSPYASQQQIAQRLLSPLTDQRFRDGLAASGTRIRAQTIRVGEERYDLFVPDMPQRGTYGLLVFVYPVDALAIPSDWWRTLAREGLIFVAARRSGNDENVLDRRIPLALHGYGLAAGRYPIDPARVYVGGFSGGSRVAQLLAVGYPDVFRGALLIAGSDPIGAGAVSLPPRDLVTVLQSRSRIVLSTGSDDTASLMINGRTRASLAGLCLQGVTTVRQDGVGHRLPAHGGFARALLALQRPVEDVDAGPCRAQIDEKINAALADVDALIVARRFDEARTRLGKIDAEYGWLAAPTSIALARKLAEPPLRDAGASGG